MRGLCSAVCQREFLRAFEEVPHQLQARKTTILIAVDHELRCHRNTYRAIAKHHPPRKYSQKAHDPTLFPVNEREYACVAPRISQEDFIEIRLKRGRRGPVLVPKHLELKGRYFSNVDRK